ncbi:unnamed protein product [Dibothriocephalus latus]|uniref:Reverse transcriptase domain-containing protein n=1 Tax=Dibothriocephalus latus TaxID=60516 RepID=A0A3P7MQG3_DIBLA|nr:unnamed protein product [Dibothriocephalus latus]
MIFAARQPQKVRTHLGTTFVGLTKAFDTVNRKGIWKLMQKFGCPEHFIHMQGCAHAPTLFSLMFSAMLMDAYHDECTGIRIN